MGRLKNKVALVIGGASGIGLAIAKRFSQEGADVFITGRREADLQEVQQEDGRVRAIRADAADLHDLERVFATVRSERSRLDILVVNAGLSEHATLDQVTQEHFDRTFGLNVRSLLFASRAGAGMMGAGGAIVLIGSIAGMIGTAGYGVYGASKAAVRSFTRTWANELAPKGIRVNVVSPGPVDTAMFASVSADVRDGLTKLIPLGRLGRPEEVAAAALFLAGEESSFVTGAELCVDGGMAQV
ncbi:SDR family NAD(P)-dependent oxidoreductase [Methylobacterium nodulans]|uniref:Short-chain dehydrogenase/reductase SDR n=1 Tax=Methylobacterium nodulans (strain LMG 21967 / CNCM I-2342 / ORS 2060) TaxID=460265 RepID=B8IAB5_METNO|nr:SDR family oxidoreductase [Methylobacterium nodulans]ACL59178.1 short-chain dehydrogenase/reductase SDR [Methylobacterium nodulans ORS 2060]